MCTAGAGRTLERKLKQVPWPVDAMCATQDGRDTWTLEDSRASISMRQFISISNHTGDPVSCMIIYCIFQTLLLFSSTLQLYRSYRPTHHQSPSDRQPPGPAFIGRVPLSTHDVAVGVPDCVGVFRASPKWEGYGNVDYPR